WNWGTLEAAPFLPRVTHGRLVLSPARWHVGGDTLASLQEARSDGELFRAAQALRQSLDLPRIVRLEDGDNTLLIDLENILSLDALAPILRTRREVRLSEVDPPPDELLAQGPEGRFVHELVVPFVRRREIAAVAPSVSAPMPRVARRFAPG